MLGIVREGKLVEWRHCSSLKQVMGRFTSRSKGVGSAHGGSV